MGGLRGAVRVLVEDLSLVDDKRYVDDGALAVVALGQPVDFDDRGHGAAAR